MKYKGLSTKEAGEALASYGQNEIKDTNKRSGLSILLGQIKNNFIVYLLFVAMAISFFVDKDITAYTILAVIIVVIFSGFIQEYKAEEAIESLKKMIMPVTIVIRNGKEEEIESKNLVPGDIVVLRTGEKVPADCVILEQTVLMLNESILTGESKEIIKNTPLDPEKYNESNLLFAGSFVVSGKCIAKIVHTGMNTRFGKIAGMISKAEKELPLQTKINKITKFMALIGASTSILIGLIILSGSQINEVTIVEVLILVIAISVSAFPEGFPVVLVTTLSVGAYKMAKKNAIVNRMSIIETLGETTVVCTDKTGTITKGEMTVKKIYCNGNNYNVSGVGYEADGDFSFSGKKIDPNEDTPLSLFIKTATLCNDAIIKRSEDFNGYHINGQPTEGALLVMATKAKLFKETFSGDRLEEIPFSSERKMMSVKHQDEKGIFVFSKGAPEIILAKSDRIQKKSKAVKLNQAEKDKIISEYKKMNSQAYRSIALAYKKTNTNKNNDLENNLVFLGLAAIEDPPRKEVKKSLLICKEAGIKVKMITGDNKETAISIASQIGLEKGRVMDGDEIEKLSDEELSKIVNEVTIFARVRPAHKLKIVKALKDNKEIVTMTGDGVNDSPALKEAHIGVAMGKAGTDVSRSASDLILKDDNFATIVEAIKEGRAIFNNIQKFTSYQLSCNYAELSILLIGVLLTPFLGWPVPVLLALHILFMNLVTDNLPAITLGFNNASPDIMKKNPRRNAKILNKSTIIPLIISSTIMTVFSLIAFWFSFNIMENTISESRTLALLVLILLQIAGAFSFRSFRKTALNRSPFVNKYLVYASLASLAATIAIIYTPLNIVFETSRLGIGEWLLAGSTALLATLIIDLLKKANDKFRYIVFD